MIAAASREITRIPERLLLTALIIAGILFAYWLMRRGWRNMLERQGDIAEPAPLHGGPAIAGPWEGLFLGSSFAGRWLERVAVHDLGARSRVRVSVTEQGIDFEREGARSFSIPNAALIGVRADSGIAGRAYETGGIIVFTFRLGDTEVECGTRFPSTDDHLAVLTAWEAAK